MTNRRPSRFAAHALLAASALILAGCYSYVPVDLQQVPVDQTVRTRLTGTGAVKLRDLLGINATVVEGKFLERRDTLVVIGVPSGMMQAGMRTELLHQRVELARADVAMVELRQLNKQRTLIAASAGALLLAFVVFQALEGNLGGSDGDGDDGSGDRSVVPATVR